MAKNINKYWENEDPIEVNTEHMEFRNFPEAGKFQMYGRFEVDGETRRTKAIVLDTGDIAVSEATTIVQTIMESLFDVSIGKDTMNAIMELVTNSPARDDEEVSEEELAEVLDEEFEDETTGYADMEVKDLRAECKNRGIKCKRGMSKDDLVNLLETYDDEHDDTSALADEKADTVSEDTIESYDGKWLNYNAEADEVVAAPKRKKADKAEAAEWLEYFEACLDEIAGMVKKVTNKKAKTVDIVKLKKLMDKWIPEFEADEDTNSMLADFVGHFFSDIKADQPVQLTPERKRELCMIVDQM